MPSKSEQRLPTGEEVTKPVAYVYGGGVAGMTAAHELAIRGFKVHLYEQDRALGPRGILDEPSLGGMARTQYFATTPAQKLYFHVEPLARLLAQLHRPESQDAVESRLASDKEARQLLAAFFEMLWEFLLTSGDVVAAGLLDALGKVLRGANLFAFTKALKKELLETRILALLSKTPLSLKTFMEEARACLRSQYAQGLARKKAGHALALALTRAFVIDNRGRLRLACLRELSEAGVVRSGLLPDVLAFFLKTALQSLLPSIDPLYYLYNSYRETKKMRGEESQGLIDRALAFNLRVTQPVQMLDAGGNFPECWLEFTREDGSFQLSDESQAVLEVAVRYVKDLIVNKQFHTETGEMTDVRILVQSFAAPGLAGMQALAKARPAGGAALAAESADELANWAVKMLQRHFEGALPAQRVQVYTKSGGFLNTYAPAGFAPSMRNWIRVIFFRPQLPGEHGYRFFPSYYRHVFDTMRRIPLQAAPGQPLGGTVLDNLVPLPEIGIFSERGAPFIMSWTPSPPGAALSRADYNRRNLASLNVSSQDLLQFSLRVLRYMTSCSRRRAAEMEELSWWEYLEGRESGTGIHLYQYSKNFEHLIKSSSRVLAAFDGANGDARTCGNTYVQLLTQALVPTEYGNCTLNGPTTEAWFTHWRRYLEELEVEFHHGDLQFFFTGKKGALEAQVRRFSKVGKDTGAEVVHHGAEGEARDVYFVVATDLTSAAAATRFLDDGMSRQLHAYAHRVPKEERSDASNSRNPKDVSRRQPWDRFQTIAGIQFFFQKHVNVFDGYIYCVDAEWGLSAICSHLVWRERPTGSSLNPYQSILSVDIGDWNTPSKYLGIPACECTPEQLRDEVLRQLRVSLSTRESGRSLDGSVLPEPDWVHIDESLEFESFEGEGGRRKLIRNNAPYLVPTAGDWKRRPGPQPWDPSPESDPVPCLSFEENRWQAPHGGYPVYYKRLVFAGTYLKTFTRMTTMESANESARHAVNAILDHYTARHASTREEMEVWRVSRERGPTVFNPYERGLFPTSPQGDYCRIWDPEQHELPDFELLQQQDDENLRQGRPHPMDALGLEALPSLLAQTSGTGESFDQLLKWVASGSAAAPWATQGLLALLRHLRSVLEANRPPRGY